MTVPDRRRRVLLVSSSAGARAPYDEAATRIPVDLADESSSAPIDGVLAIDAASAGLAAAAAERLGLPWHPSAGVETSASPLLARGRLMAAGLPVPWFFTMPSDGTLASVADRVRFPCVVKPVGRRGAVRADDPAEFEAACARHRGHRQTTDETSHRPHRQTQTEEGLIVEGYVPGGELVVQGVLTHGALHVLAMIETSEAPRTRDEERLIAGMVAHATAALGLRHGPIHARCRVNPHGVFVLTLEPGPIEPQLARRLRFGTVEGAVAPRDGITLAEILLRHAVGESLDGYGRDAT